MTRYKHLFLSLFLTCLFVFFCRPFFYPSDVILSFDAKVSSPVDFIVSPLGKGVRETAIKQQLKQNAYFQKLNFILPVKHLSGIRIDFSPNPGDIELRNIRVGGVREVDLLGDDISFTQDDIDFFDIDEDMLEFSSSQKDPSIIFAMQHPLFANGDFIFPIFFSISVLFFLFFYKLTKYLPRGWAKISFAFSSLSDDKDVVFLIVMSVLLVFPALNVDFESTSSRENRILAEQAMLFKNGRVNNNFGKEFDSWFKDRFTGRNGIIDSYNGIQNRINKKFERNGVILGKNGWMFHGRTKNFQGTDFFSDTELHKIKENLLKLQKFCDENGIKLYVAVTPYKHHVYSEFYPDAVKKKYEIDRVDRLKDYLSQENAGINFIYLKEALLKEKNKTHDWLYFKTDHHWTDKGAYIAYTELMKLINKDFSDIKPVKEKSYDFSHGNMVRAEWDRQMSEGVQYALLNYKDESILDLDFVYYDHKDRRNLKADIISPAKGFFAYDKGADKKVFFITDSFGENLMGFLPYTFKNMQKRRFNAEIKTDKKNQDLYMSFYEKDILDYKTDILLLEIYDAYTPSFSALYEE